MIKLHDAELISVLPPYVKEDADVQAISYAFKKGMAKLLQFAETVQVYAAIDNLPEKLVDLLALELQCQYYDESMNIETKRGMIKNSLAWYSKGGTVSAVEEMIQMIFGEGKVTEWYQFEGTPGTFRIETDTEMSPDVIKKLTEIIEKVKNKKSHLTSVFVNRKMYTRAFIAVHNRQVKHIVVKDNGLNNVHQTIYMAIKIITQKYVVINSKGEE